MKPFSLTCSTVLILSAAPAMAQITPADVAARFEGMTQVVADNLSYALETGPDGNVTLRDIIILDDEGDIVLRQTEGEIVIATMANGDYDVEIQGLERLAFEALEDGEVFGSGDMVHAAGYRYMMRGTPDRIESLYEAAKVTVDSVSENEFSQTDISMVYEDMKSTGLTDTAEGTGTSDIRIGRVTTTTETLLKGESGSSRALSISQDNLYRIEWTGMPLATRLSAFEAGEMPLITGDDAFTLSGTSGQARSLNETTTPDGRSMVVDAITDASAANFELASGTLAGQLSTQDMEIKLAGTVLSFPKSSVSMAGFDMQISAPVLSTSEIVDANFSLQMESVTASDSLWSLFDAQGALPRDPADLSVDLALGLRLAEGLLTRGFAGGPDAEPATVETLRINDVSLNALGVDLGVEGEMVFDNSGPVPVPEGVVNAEVSGLNGLLDALSGLGLLPPEMMMGARMMMGVMLVPTSEPDSFTSTIELDADGSVTANGVPLQ